MCCSIWVEVRRLIGSYFSPLSFTCFGGISPRLSSYQCPVLRPLSHLALPAFFFQSLLCLQCPAPLAFVGSPGAFVLAVPTVRTFLRAHWAISHIPLLSWWRPERVAVEKEKSCLILPRSGWQTVSRACLLIDGERKTTPHSSPSSWGEERYILCVTKPRLSKLEQLPKGSSVSSPAASVGLTLFFV